MLPLRPSLKLRSALSLGGGFSVARSLFQGISFSDIARRLRNRFGLFTQSDVDSLIAHALEMRDAGRALTQLSPGSQLDLSNVPVNPWLGEQVLEGSRAVSEIVLPWQDQNTGQAGEWWHRVRFVDVISVDEITDDVSTWVARHSASYIPPQLRDWLSKQFNTGSFVGVAIERAW